MGLDVVSESERKRKRNGMEMTELVDCICCGSAYHIPRQILGLTPESALSEALRAPGPMPR